MPEKKKIAPRTLYTNISLTRLPLPLPLIIAIAANMRPMIPTVDRIMPNIRFSIKVFLQVTAYNSIIAILRPIRLNNICLGVPLRVRLYAVVLACGCGLPLPSFTRDQAGQGRAQQGRAQLGRAQQGRPKDNKLDSRQARIGRSGKRLNSLFMILNSSVQLPFLLRGQALTAPALYIGHL
jgi:hypothetical protein